MGELTPGPWTVGDLDPDGWPIQAKQDPLDVCVATVYGLDDARLIAKARHLPELIAALKIAQGYVQAVEHQLGASHSPNVITPDLAKINAALALVQDKETGT